MRDIDIFIRADKPLADLASELSTLLGLRLEFDGRQQYRYEDEKKMIYLMRHDWEDDLGIAFSKYPFDLAVCTRPPRFQDEITQSYVQALRAKTDYPFIVVQNVDMKLDERP